MTIVRQSRADLFAILGRLEAAETEVGLCWAAARSGAVRVVEFGGPLAGDSPRRRPGRPCGRHRRAPPGRQRRVPRR